MEVIDVTATQCEETGQSISKKNILGANLAIKAKIEHPKFAATLAEEP